MRARSTFLGATAMTAASTLRVLIQIIILPVIGRILGPNAYGQIALVSPFIMFALVLAESGLGAVIVRAPEVTPALEGTVFCFSTAFSLLIIVLFAVAAWPLGQILHEPNFPALLVAMSGILLFASYIIVPAGLLLREKRYKWIAMSDVAATLGSVIAVIIGISLGWGVWSLVAQQIALWVSKVAVITLGTRWRPKFIFQMRYIRDNIKFGANLTIASIFSFIARNIDNILIGAFLGSEILGYYALAFQVVGMPQMVLAGSVYMTMFSKTSEAQRAGQPPAPHFLRMWRGVLLLTTPVMIGMAVTAPLSVPLILGDKWLPAIPLLIWLTPLGLWQSAGAAMSGVMIGLGRSDITLRLGVTASSATIIAILIGVTMGSTAVAIGVSLSGFFGSAILIRALAKTCNIPVRQMLEAAMAPVISSLVMGAVVIAVEYLLPEDMMLLLRLVICIAAGIAAYALLLAGLFHDRLALDIAEIKSILFKRQAQQQ